MAIDIERIKANLNRLDPTQKTGGGNSNNNIWKPDAGEGSNTYNVRFVPYKFDEGNPFREFYWHYNIAGKNFLCPKYHGEGSCPVCDFASTVWKEFTETGNESYKEMFKKLMPKLRAYAPVIVRGEENKGVRVWAISEGAYKQVMKTVVSCDEEGIDIIDPKDGLDFKVTAISKKVKKPYGAIEVEAMRKTSPMLEDMSSLSSVLENCPNIDDEFSPLPIEDVKKALDEYANRFENEPSSDVGTTRNVSDEKSPSTPKTETSSNDLQKELDDIFSGAGDLPFE